ncbi:hypothetical protein B0H63DRAFT_217238 [Podospora didyma]|uniref:Uncharacterized protein n=1 Tax=Podospora didyma TaxID=330526 RepID=A0AAE0TWF1_9PEZI|nr:hypothetical protein B0H63DRAFT_217238 [Podospora didyma]
MERVHPEMVPLHPYRAPLFSAESALLLAHASRCSCVPSPSSLRLKQNHHRQYQPLSFSLVSRSMLIINKRRLAPSVPLRLISHNTPHQRVSHLSKRSVALAFQSRASNPSPPKETSYFPGPFFAPPTLSVEIMVPLPVIDVSSKTQNGTP